MEISRAPTNKIIQSCLYRWLFSLGCCCCGWSCATRQIMRSMEGIGKDIQPVKWLNLEPPVHTDRHRRLSGSSDEGKENNRNALLICLIASTKENNPSIILYGFDYVTPKSRTAKAPLWNITRVTEMSLLLRVSCYRSGSRRVNQEHPHVSSYASVPAPPLEIWIVELIIQIYAINLDQCWVGQLAFVCWSRV